jgi:Domain of unknown function (DUF4340)
MTKNIIAAVVLIVLGVAALLILRESLPDEEQTKTMAVLKSVDPGQLDTIRIVRTDGQGETAKREKIVLKKQGETWRMIEPVDYSIIPSAAQRMTKALEELKLIDVISENKDKHSTFKVDDKEGIEVTALKGTTELAHFIVGSTQRSITFVRLPGKDQVYRAQKAFRFAFDRSVKVLREKSVFKTDSKSVTKLTIVNGESELTLAKGEGPDGKFAPINGEINNFDEAKASSLTNYFTNLSTREFVDEVLSDEKTGLGTGSVSIQVEATRDGEPVTATLWIGNDEQSTTYVKTSEQKQVFRIPASTAKQLRVTADDFARSDEEMEAAAKRASEATAQAPMGAQPPPGSQMIDVGADGKIPPELMKQIQAQLAAKQAAAQK